MFEKIDFKAIIETVTHRGATTQYLYEIFGLPIYTVEKNPRYYYFCKLRFKHNNMVKVENNDSSTFLYNLSKDNSMPTAKYKNLLI